ncbi:MAG: ribosomal protein S18 acetylase RimI-like enzyme [Algoriphagus sp.]|jgi:ribosomal protein S18 acetylase RimI-like enzyme
MIKKLLNRELEISKEIYSVFQVSYKIEAKLLNATNFPPLKRPLKDYMGSNTDFYGYLKNGGLVGVIEIDGSNRYIHIKSLVVNPLFFRQGIAKELIEYVFNEFDSNLFTVETGLANGPAIRLYKKFGFIEVKQWDTDHGIRKIKFEKRVKN